MRRACGVYLTSRHANPHPPSRVLTSVVALIRRGLTLVRAGDGVAYFSATLEGVVDIIRNRLTPKATGAAFVTDPLSVIPIVDELSSAFREAVVALLTTATGDEGIEDRVSMLLSRVKDIKSLARCAFAPPGNAVSSPAGPHIQAHQPSPRPQGAPLARLEMARVCLYPFTSRHTNPLASALRAVDEARATRGGEPAAESVLTQRVTPWKGWTSPTVGWLMTSSWHRAEHMRGIYQSPEEYAATLARVWTVLTFYWGSGAVWPKCRCAAHGGENQCGEPLLSPAEDGARCKFRTEAGPCSRPAVLRCHKRDHDAICARCLSARQDGMVGYPGQVRLSAAPI